MEFSTRMVYEGPRGPDMNEWFQGKSCQWIDKDLIEKIDKFPGKTFSEKIRRILEAMER